MDLLDLPTRDDLKRLTDIIVGLKEHLNILDRRLVSVEIILTMNGLAHLANSEDGVKNKPLTPK